MGNNAKAVDINEIRKDVDLPYYNNLSFSGTDTVASINIALPTKDGKLKYHTILLGSLQTLSYSIHMDRHPIRAIGNVNAKDYVMGPRTIAGSIVFTVFNQHWTSSLIKQIKEENESNEAIAMLADELPPFDIIISLANEYGAKARMVIYGVRFVNEGQVMSVNDIYTENTYQYYATDIDYLASEGDAKDLTYYYGTKKLIADSSTAIAAAPITTGNVLKQAVIGDKMQWKNEPWKVILGVDTTPANELGGKGSAKFTLTPRQSKGIITITKPADENKPDDQKFNLEFKIEDFLASDRLSGNITAPLSPDRYSAVYTNSEQNVTSNIRDFFISDYIAPAARIYPAPIIINRTEDSMTISVNTYGYTNISYAPITTGDAPLAFNTIKAESNKAVIAGLIPDTKYRIYASDDAGFKSSNIDVSTLKSNLEPYNDLKQFIFTNSDKLIPGMQVSDYYDCIDMASNISSQQLYRISIQDALYLLKLKLMDERKGIDESSYNSEDEYQQALNDTDNKILIARHLMVLTENQVNNEHYILNYAGADIKPVQQPKITDPLTATIQIPDDAAKLDVYSFGTNRLVKSVSAERVNSSLKFLGRPGDKYYAQAINPLGEKSPRLEFAVMQDEDKPTYISKQKSNNDALVSNYNLASSEIRNNLIQYRLDDEGIKDMVTTHGKSKCAETAPSPVIVDYDDSKITINISMLDLIGNTQLPYFAVIAERDNAFNNDMFRKQEFHIGDETVIFTAEKDFIRPDKSYIFWIEDSSHAQISKCTPLNMSDDEEVVAKKKEIILDLKKQEIISSMTNKSMYSQDLLYCIDAAIVDEDTNANNIYEKIIEKVINYNTKFLNESFVVKALIECKVESKSIIDDNFFNTTIKIDSAHKTVITPMRSSRYTVTVYKIDRNGFMTFDSIAVDQLSTQDILLDRNYKYMSVFCIATDPVVKSDILFIDVLAEGYRSLKNRVEVI